MVQCSLRLFHLVPQLIAALPTFKSERCQSGYRLRGLLSIGALFQGSGFHAQLGHFSLCWFTLNYQWENFHIFNL